ncbi:AAA family ATPase [Allokutzneria sp. A3M-2-11 16]|uniref:ATP-binding protein n=1 Tax=Allokutzneria sp. A3M-2-11 16 TaxID=2962043 RepID=UPI0020B6A52B|nr:AAA family ATPase [Allokutzneria sp. A3M-2-11 16]MCP3804463.1 AAA family ATPase [Allokutzneria sp. A3M-2-11 16]
MRLIERDRELAAQSAALGEALAGCGSVLLVEGAPGIGKTALLRAAAEDARERGFGVFTAVGGELDQELPFAVVRQLLEPALVLADPAARAELLADAAGLAAPVFGLGGERVENAVGSVVHGLYWLCSNLADRAPMLLVVDDVHWADEASLRFLSHLARRIADLPVLLLVGGRPGRMLDDFVARALSGVPPKTLCPEPLSTDGVGLLVRRNLDAAAEDEFCRACATATGGNPFLLAEALTSLRADGIRPVADEAHRVENLRPDTISRTVLTRIARLGPDAVRLARAVAVLGQSADLRHVAQLADLTVPAAATLADTLTRETIFAPGRPVEFVHPLVRTAVYLDSSEVLRASEHKRAALVLADGDVAGEHLAPHLLAAEPESDPWVVETLNAAATSALGRGAPEPAAAFLRRALAEPPVPAQRGPLFAAFGRALGMANRPVEAADALREAIALAEHPMQRVGLLFELGFVMLLIGRGREAVESFRTAHSLVGELDVDLSAQLSIALALADFTNMEAPQDWVRRLDQAAAGLSGEADVDRMILGLLAFGACATGDRPAAEVARLARVAGAGPLPPRDQWMLVNMASSALAISDHLPESLALLDRGLDEARRLGDAAEFRYLAVLRSHTALFAGRLHEAEADGRTALDLWGDSRPRDTPLAAAVLVEALLDRGAVDEAQQVLTERDLDGDQPFDLLIGHFVLQARGRLRRQQNRLPEAIADLHYCGEKLFEHGYTNPSFAPWRPEAALAHLALGDAETAGRLAEQDLELARAFGAPRQIALALRAGAAVSGGKPGLDALEEAVTILAESPAELEKARCLVEYGAALRRAGQRKQAQEPLRQGLDAAARCGARLVVTQAREELAAAGARPRREMLTGRESLTSSELRIARFAADGATNKEIAQTLFLSRRTVEIHLTNTYRKLDITSRQELRAALATG